MSKPRVSDSARKLAGLRAYNPAEWRRVVRAALREHGSIADASKALGVGWRTVAGWLADDPTLKTGLELRGPGRPKNST